MNELLDGLTPEDFFNALPSNTRKTALSMLETGIDPLDIASLFATSPAEGLNTKGGELWPQDMLSRIIAEVKLLACSDSQEYQETRNRLRMETGIAASAILYIVSNAIAIRLGMAAALCVPLVAAVLASIAKVGIKAWCQPSN